MRLRNRHALAIPAFLVYIVVALCGLTLFAGDVRAARIDHRFFPGDVSGDLQTRDSTVREMDTAEVSGTVRNNDTDTPIANVRISAADGTEVTKTGADGRYTIHLAIGSRRLQFTHSGYESLAIVVRVDRANNSTVDVSLTPHRAVLPAVRIQQSSAELLRSDSLRMTNAVRQADPYGAQIWSRHAIRAAPQFIEADLTRLAATAPNVAMQQASPSSLHLAGGAADQTLVLLNGIPIENAVHAGRVTSAINPDAIERMVVYADHIPARFGERLSGVVELHTRGEDAKTATPDTLTSARRQPPTATFSGIASYAELALLVTGEDAARGASGLLSVRHSLRELGQFWKPNTGTLFLHHTGWSDVLARGAMPLAGGTVSALAFQSRDAQQFGEPQSLFPIGTGLEWMSSAFGGGWTRALGRSRANTVSVRGWRSGSTISGAWQTNPSRIATLANTFSRTGAAVESHATRKRAEVHAGASVERHRSSYGALPYLLSPSNVIISYPASQLTFAGTLTEMTLYTDVRWHLSERMTLLPGARLTHAAWNGHTEVRADPRMGLSVKLRPKTWLSTSYTHASQRLRSLRNEEVVFDGLVGVNFLNVPNDMVPVSTSSTIAAMLTSELSPVTTLAVGAYGRTFHNLIVAPSVGTAPFLTESLDTGPGTGEGWYATMSRATPAVTLEGTLRTMNTHYGATRTRYQPQFSSTRFASVAAGWRLGRKTELHAFSIAMGGQRASATAAPFSATVKDQLGGPNGGYGSTQTSNPGSQRLPPYIILNTGISRALSLADPQKRLGLRAFGAVDNVFNHANTIGVQREVNDAQSDHSFIRYRPRTFTLGVEWQW